MAGSPRRRFTRRSRAVQRALLLVWALLVDALRRTRPRRKEDPKSSTPCTWIFSLDDANRSKPANDVVERLNAAVSVAKMRKMDFERARGALSVLARPAPFNSALHGVLKRT
jgi:hypothetical protein